MKNNQSEPANTANNSKKSKLLYVFKDDAITIQSKKSFLKLNFLTPIIQAYQFIQRFEKYRLKSELLSIPIKAKEFDHYYTQIKQSIEKQFDEFLKKAVESIEEIILCSLYFRINRWYNECNSIEIFKRIVLKKDIDCYGFNPSQFMQKYNRVIEIIDKSETGVINREEDTRVEMDNFKEQIKRYQRSIEENEVKILNKDMLVKNPYKAQNTQNEQIDASALFAEYRTKLGMLTQRIQADYKIKQNNIHEQITQLFSDTIHHTEAYQKIVDDLANNFYEKRINGKYSSEQTSKINFNNKIELLSREEIQPKWSMKDEKNSCLENKLEKVSVSPMVVVYDEEKKDLYYNSYEPIPVKINKNLYRISDINQNKAPISSPYMDIWDMTYDREKLRKLHLCRDSFSFSQANFKEIVTQRMKMQWGMEKTSSKNLTKKQTYNKELQKIFICIYSEIFKRISEAKEEYWKEKYQRKVQNDHNRLNYENQSENKNHYWGLQIKRELEQKQRERLEKARDEFYQKNLKYEKEHHNQLQLRTMNGCLSRRTYEQFCKMMQIPYQKSKVVGKQIFRYNSKVNKTLYENSTIKMQQFLCSYIRERMYRQKQSIVDKKSVYLFLYSKPIEKFCCKNSIKFLLKKITDENYKKYVLWGPDIILYEERVNPQKLKQGKFTIFRFQEEIYSQIIGFQLKRFAPFPIAFSINSKFFRKTENNPFHLLMNKFEIVSRLCLSTHLECPDGQISEIKGRQLFDEMFGRLETEIGMIQSI